MKLNENESISQNDRDLEDIKHASKQSDLDKNQKEHPYIDPRSRSVNNPKIPDSAKSLKSEPFIKLHQKVVSPGATATVTEKKRFGGRSKYEEKAAEET